MKIILAVALVVLASSALNPALAKTSNPSDLTYFPLKDEDSGKALDCVAVDSSGSFYKATFKNAKGKNTHDCSGTFKGVKAVGKNDSSVELKLTQTDSKTGHPLYKKDSRGNDTNVPLTSTMADLSLVKYNGDTFYMKKVGDHIETCKESSNRFRLADQGHGEHGKNGSAAVTYHAMRVTFDRDGAHCSPTFAFNKKEEPPTPEPQNPEPQNPPVENKPVVINHPTDIDHHCGTQRSWNEQSQQCVCGEDMNWDESKNECVAAMPQIKPQPQPQPKAKPQVECAIRNSVTASEKQSYCSVLEGDNCARHLIPHWCSSACNVKQCQEQQDDFYGTLEDDMDKIDQMLADFRAKVDELRKKGEGTCLVITQKPGPKSDLQFYANYKKSAGEDGRYKGAVNRLCPPTEHGATSKKKPSPGKVAK